MKGHLPSSSSEGTYTAAIWCSSGRIDAPKRKLISSLEIILKKRKYWFNQFVYHTLSAYADCLFLWCWLWVVHLQPMSQRAAAVRGAAAPLHPPSPPLTHPLCLDKLTPAHCPSVMPPAPLSMKLPHLLPCRPHLQGHPRPLHPRQPRPPTTTRGRSAASAVSSGSRYQRRRYVGSPTSGRWRCGSSSTRSMFAPWRSCSASRRRRRQAYVSERQPLEPQLVSPGLAPSRRAARMRWVVVMSLKTDTSNTRKFVLTANKEDDGVESADSDYTPVLLRFKLSGKSLYSTYRTWHYS